MDFNSISNRIENSKPLDFGNIFSRSIELFKEVWLQGFITLLFTFITILPIVIVFYIPMIGIAIFDQGSLDRDAPPILLTLSMIILIPILVLCLMMISMALSAAFLRICRLKDLKEDGADDYFYYFKKPYRKKLFMLSLIMLCFSLLIIITCGLAAIYLVVPISLFPAFLAFDKELSAVEIVKASFTLGNKNWLVIFGLVIVAGLVAELGIIACGIGILFTASLAKIPPYFMYKDAILGDANLSEKKIESTEDRLNNLLSSSSKDQDLE